jgi:hypothetical protein
MRKYIQELFNAYLGEIKLCELTTPQKFLDQIKRFIGEVIDPSAMNYESSDEMV